MCLTLQSRWSRWITLENMWNSCGVIQLFVLALIFWKNSKSIIWIKLFSISSFFYFLFNQFNWFLLKFISASERDFNGQVCSNRRRSAYSNGFKFFYELSKILLFFFSHLLFCRNCKGESKTLNIGKVLFVKLVGWIKWLEIRNWLWVTFQNEKC